MEGPNALCNTLDLQVCAPNGLQLSLPSRWQTFTASMLTFTASVLQPKAITAAMAELRCSGEGCSSGRGAICSLSLVLAATRAVVAAMEEVCCSGEGGSRKDGSAICQQQQQRQQQQQQQEQCLEL